MNFFGVTINCFLMLIRIFIEGINEYWSFFLHKTVKCKRIFIEIMFLYGFTQKKTSWKNHPQKLGDGWWTPFRVNKNLSLPRTEFCTRSCKTPNAEHKSVKVWLWPETVMWKRMRETLYLCVYVNQKCSSTKLSTSR